MDQVDQTLDATATVESQFSANETISQDQTHTLPPVEEQEPDRQVEAISSNPTPAEQASESLQSLL